MINKLLNQINADELIGGRIKWGGDAMCPYSHSELVEFHNMNDTMNSKLKFDFQQFKSNYELLQDLEKKELNLWAYSEFISPMWKTTKSFSRPEWANKHFFPKINRHGKLLDVAPSHGCHGVLLYRDHYKYSMDIHTCDILPCYNKLLTILGVDVKHANISFDDIHNVYTSSFDVITVTEVLEHVNEVAENKLCISLSKITNPSAKVLITFPVKALPHGGIPVENDPLGHIRQPKVDDIISKLPHFSVTQKGKFSGGKYDQNFIILQRNDS